MSYTPQNINVFSAAYAGALAGMGVSDRVPTDPNASSYAGLAVIAGAYAQKFDTVWGLRATNGLDLDSIRLESVAAWQDRAPQTTAVNIVPESYDTLVDALVAMITAGESYFAFNGITPPPIGSGSTGNTGGTGSTGGTGNTGTAGAAGADGNTGGTGNTGNTGTAGAAGADGNTGGTGNTGTAGAAGADGNTGGTGNTGVTGTDGNTGGTGNTGISGADGNTGGTGNTGVSGSNGNTGGTGNTGVSGSNGNTGGTGNTGVSGSNGNTGGTGNTGVSGSNGNTGGTGNTGNTGGTGATGATGAAASVSSAHVTTDITLANDPTFTDLVSVTMTGTTFLVQAYASAICTASNPLRLRVQTDGATINYQGTYSGIAGAFTVAASLVFVSSGLSNASHTFKLQGAYGGTANACTIHGATNPTLEGAWLVVTNLT